MKTVAVAACVLAWASVASAQARGAAPARPRPADTRPSSLRATVRDDGGAALDNVKVTLSGQAPGDTTTNGFGVALFSGLHDGTYRVRFDREGFLSFEREVTLKPGQPTAIDVVLNPAPPPPPPPPPPKPAAPPALPPGGPPVTMSIPNFLDKNLIGREPLKESVFACTPIETVRLLQLREPMAEHSHPDSDEVLYVVAGEGAIRLGGDAATPVAAGALMIVPHGTRHAIERRGRNPLILVSTLAGAPCQAATR